MRPVREDTGPRRTHQRRALALGRAAAAGERLAADCRLPGRRRQGRWVRSAPGESGGWILFSAMTSKGLRSAMGLGLAAVEAAAGKTP
jgi:hypothetical protein